MAPYFHNVKRDKNATYHFLPITTHLMNSNHNPTEITVKIKAHVVHYSRRTPNRTLNHEVSARNPKSTRGQGHAPSPVTPGRASNASPEL